MKNGKAQFQGKRILIIGLGASGQSAAAYLLSQKAQVVGIDRDRELLKNNIKLHQLRSGGLLTFHENDSIEVSAFDIVIVSPGVPKSHPIYQSALESNKKILGEAELAFLCIKQPCLAITGTNGKTTVTLLINHVLNQTGKKAAALGNVGTSLTSAICYSGLTEKEIIVAELSSFQLETMHSQVIDAGVILNITPDHLDRYDSIEDYAKAKIHLQKCLKPSGKLFVQETAFIIYRKHFNHPHLFTYGYGPHCSIYTDLSAVFVDGVKALELPGYLQGKASHDLENVMAALALCREAGVSADQFLEALPTFKKPSHRIEYVCTHDGVSYYDDSKGTNIDAVIRAVNSLPGSIVLIAGGVDKGSSYAPWLPHFIGKVSHICAIGAAAPKIREELGSKLSVKLFESLETAVLYASQVAQCDGNVLLSPGCSSFDMFKDYAHRGEEFQRIVHALSAKNFKEINET